MCVCVCVCVRVSFGEHVSLPANDARSPVCRLSSYFLFRFFSAVVSSSIRVVFLVRKHDMIDPARLVVRENGRAPTQQSLEA